MVGLRHSARLADMFLPKGLADMFLPKGLADIFLPKGLADIFLPKAFGDSELSLDLVEAEERTYILVMITWTDG